MDMSLQQLFRPLFAVQTAIAHVQSLTVCLDKLEDDLRDQGPVDSCVESLCHQIRYFLNVLRHNLLVQRLQILTKLYRRLRVNVPGVDLEL